MVRFFRALIERRNLVRVFVTGLAASSTLAGSSLLRADEPREMVIVAPERFHEWFAAAVPRADAVVVTPQLMMWMSPANAAAVRECGKPVLFGTEGTRAAFEATYGPGP